jgi:hypothetical protein
MPASGRGNKATRRLLADKLPLFDPRLAMRLGCPPKMSTSALLIGGRVIRLKEVNSPCRLQYAKFWLPLVELQKARTFVSLSKSAALHGVAARSVVVQVFDSLSSGPLRDAMLVHRRVGVRTESAYSYARYTSMKMSLPSSNVSNSGRRRALRQADQTVFDVAIRWLC